MARTAKGQSNPGESEAALDFEHDNPGQAVPDEHHLTDADGVATSLGTLSAEDLDALAALKHDATSGRGLRHHADSGYEIKGAADDVALLAEYDGDLRQPTYDPTNSPLDRRELKLDRFLSGVPHVSSTQYEEIARRLREFRPAEFRRWLPWLEEQQWTGESLILLLEFHEHWMATPDWWEYSSWDSRLNCWAPYRNPSTLSKRALYDLIQHRLNFPPSRVINETWLTDWKNWSLWERGFQTFASFALFRASIPEKQSWVSHLPSSESRQSLDDIDAMEPSERRITVTGHRDPANLSEWFALHDWYDSHEWNDGLGV